MCPVGIYLLKVNNRNTTARCEICSKITSKTPERRQWRHSGVFIVKFEHIIADWDAMHKNVMMNLQFQPGIYLLKVSNRNTRAVFKVKNKDTRTKSKTKTKFTKNPTHIFGYTIF